MDKNEIIEILKEKLNKIEPGKASFNESSDKCINLLNYFKTLKDNKWVVSIKFADMCYPYDIVELTKNYIVCLGSQLYSCLS